MNTVIRWVAAASLAFLPVLLCPATARSQTAPGAPASRVTLRLIRSTTVYAHPHSSSSSNPTKLTVSLNAKKFVTDAVYYTSSCVSGGIGKYKSPDLPLYGTLDLNVITNIQDLNNDACKGQTFQGVSVYYTWKINKPGVTEDPFDLTLTDPEGNVTTSYWVAELYIPQNQAGQLFFTNPYASAIAANNIPSQVTSETAPNAPAATGMSADGNSPVVAVYRTSSADPVQFSQAYQDSQFSSSSPVVLGTYAPGYLAQSKAPGMAANNTVTATPSCSGQVCTALALVWPPAQLPLASANLKSGDFPSVTVNITATQDTIGVSAPLILYPPPLLLVHGLWSSAKQEGFSAYSNPSGLYQWIASSYPHSLIFPVDYGEVSGQSFDSDMVQESFRLQLAGALEKAAQQGVVARTVDVVAHGMGALVTRWFLAQPPSSLAPYLVSNPVHKLVAIGTPHMGSNVAAMFWNARDTLIPVPAQPTPGTPGNSGTLIEQICLLNPSIGPNACSLKNVLASLGKPVDTGVKSLEGPALSPQLTALSDKNAPRASVLFNAILGEAPSNTSLGVHIPGVTEILLNNVTGLFVPPASILSILNNEANDTFVTLSSEEDRLANTNPMAQDIAVVNAVVNASLVPTQPSQAAETGEIASQDVWNQSLYWLKGGTGSLLSAATPPAPIPSAPIPVFDFSGYTLAPSSDITFSPASNSALTINTAVNIAASSTKTITQILLFQMVADPADVPLYYATEAPFSVPFMPARLGTANFVAFALFNDMTYTAAALTYTMQPAGHLSAVQVVDAPPVSLSVGSSVFVHARATYPTGTVDVTDAASYTAHSGTSAVFSVSPGGLITATGPGEDTLDVLYGGVRGSAPISTFCALTLSPSDQVVPDTGATVQIQVTTQPNCPWSAAMDSNWLSFTNQTGTGSGSITLAAPANPSAFLRSIHITAANQSVTVTQPAVPCLYTLSQNAINVGYSSASGTVSVSTSIFCPVVTSSDSAWLTATAGTSSIAYAVAPNPTTAPRTGTFTAGNLVVSVTQAGAPDPDGSVTPPANLPVIQATDGVVNAASFLEGIASGSWITILGTNLSSTARLWQGSDFQGNHLPTSLDGVQVKINGLPAYVYYISSTQLNVLAPADASMGPVSVQVINSQGASVPVTATKAAASPALFVYSQQNGRYAIAEQGGTYALIAPAGLLGSGVPLQQASPGESIILYATGLGQTDPPYPDGEIVQGAAKLAQPIEVKVGGVDATVQFAGIIGAGLYQVNIAVPDLQPGDAAVSLSTGGVQSAQQVFIPIVAAVH